MLIRKTLTLALACIVLTSFTVPVNAADVHANGKVYIRVTHFPKIGASSFDICRVDVPNACAALDGTDLAKKEFQFNSKPVLYSVDRIETKQKELKNDRNAAWVYDAGIGVVTVVVSVATFGYGYAGIMALLATSGATMTMVATAVGTGVLVGDYIGLSELISRYEALNPIELGRQVEMTNANVVEDGVVAIDGDAAYYAYSMNQALSKVKRPLSDGFQD